MRSAAIAKKSGPAVWRGRAVSAKGSRPGGGAFLCENGAMGSGGQSGGVSSAVVGQFGISRAAVLALDVFLRV